MPLRGTRLVAEAQGGRARVRVEQRFVNSYAEPLSVMYLLPLPADGAVAGFSFVLDGERTVGRVEKRADAREMFEQAVAEGRSAALLEEERSNVFRQEIGNLPPNQELVMEVVVDQPLVWLTEGEWEWRFPCVVAPRYLGGEGRVPDAERLTVDVLEGGPEALGAHLELSLSVRDRLRTRQGPLSPSHALAVREVAEEGLWRVALGGNERAPLDRDLVVRWGVATREPGVSFTRQGAHALLTLVPPEATSGYSTRARDLVVLIDASGSMEGAPLEQAKRVARALATLADSVTAAVPGFSLVPEPLSNR